MVYLRILKDLATIVLFLLLSIKNRRIRMLLSNEVAFLKLTRNKRRNPKYRIYFKVHCYNTVFIAKVGGDTSANYTLFQSKQNN